MAVSLWGLQPSEFWNMTPREWWLIYDSKHAQHKATMRATSPAPHFTKAERNELQRMWEDGRSKGDNNG